MVNREAEVDRLLRESLRAAGDRWEPDQDKALREILTRSEPRARRRLARGLLSVLRRFRARALVLAAAVPVLAWAMVLGPGALQTLRDPHEGTPRHVVADPAPLPGATRIEAAGSPIADVTVRRHAKMLRMTLIGFGPDLAGTLVAGEALRTVPDILHLPVPVARDRLQRRGLQVRLRAEVTRGELSSDVVTHQYPGPRQTVPANGSVTITVRTSCAACLQAQGASIVPKVA
jgi:PASTA domain